MEFQFCRIASVMLRPEFGGLANYKDLFMPSPVFCNHYCGYIVGKHNHNFL